VVTKLLRTLKNSEIIVRVFHNPTHDFNPILPRQPSSRRVFCYEKANVTIQL